MEESYLKFDTAWANSRIQQLLEELDRLADSVNLPSHVPQIDAQTALAYRSDAMCTIAHGTNLEKKRLLAAWIDQITMAPDTLEVEITYKIPKAIGEYSGSGGRAYSELYPTLVIEDVVVKPLYRRQEAIKLCDS